jgi:hypothetical protein
MIIDTLTIAGALAAAVTGTFCFFLGCANQRTDRT